MSEKDPVIVKLVDKIREEIESMTARLKELGMIQEAIEKFFDGEEVKECVHCHTPNMIEVHYDKDNEWSMYECLNCSKTHMKDWKKE
ncbi:hypothetical protein MYX07_04300 [Patescibacteria group bacterium AH-259-L07]|nr:hypothetical protein [Patescibacteria group bacterium AH-259-L07]